MKLIDKDKIVAEIERRIADNKKDIERASHKNLEDYFEGYEDALVLFKEKFLNTLEVKEVDLEEEIKSSMNNLYELGCYAQSLLDNPEDYEGFAKPFPKEVDDEIANFAKHFYELGLKAQKGE